MVACSADNTHIVTYRALTGQLATDKLHIVLLNDIQMNSQNCREVYLNMIMNILNQNKAIQHIIIDTEILKFSNQSHLLD